MREKVLFYFWNSFQSLALFQIRTFRTALEQKYNLKKRALKQNKVFMAAFTRIAAVIKENADNQKVEEENAEPGEEEKPSGDDVKASKKKKKRKGKKSKKKEKKSRKRKRPSPSTDDEHENEEESVDNPPKKKRKANSGKSIIDKEEKSEQNEEDMDASDEQTETSTKSKNKRGKKKKAEPVKHISFVYFFCVYLPLDV